LNSRIACVELAFELLRQRIYVVYTHDYFSRAGKTSLELKALFLSVLMLFLLCALDSPISVAAVYAQAPATNVSGYTLSIRHGVLQAVLML
jgi:hypothetical protein